MGHWAMGKQEVWEVWEVWEDEEEIFPPTLPTLPTLPHLPISPSPHLPISPAPYYILFNAVKCKTVFYLLKKHRTLLQINIIDCKIRRIKVKSHSSSEKDEYYGDFSCGFLICSVGSTWRSELVFS